MFGFNQYRLPGLRHGCHTGSSCRLSVKFSLKSCWVVFAGLDQRAGKNHRKGCALALCCFQRLIEESFGVSYNEKLYSTDIEETGVWVCSGAATSSQTECADQANFKKILHMVHSKSKNLGKGMTIKIWVQAGWAEESICSVIGFTGIRAR